MACASRLLMGDHVFMPMTVRDRLRWGQRVIVAPRPGCLVVVADLVAPGLSSMSLGFGPGLPHPG
jgi:hypothetical protein